MDRTGTLISEYQYTPGSTWMTNPLFKRDGPTGVVHFYLNDHLGTPRKLFDTSGQITWAARHEAFGKTTITAELTDNSLRFPGQYEDGETGISYNGFRSYDSQTGIYVQRDPLGLFGGSNVYAYANANPVRYVDPLGLVPWTAGRGRISRLQTLQHGRNRHKVQWTLPQVLVTP